MHLILTQVFKFLLGGSFAGDLEFNKYTLEYMGLSGCTLWVQELANGVYRSFIIGRLLNAARVGDRTLI